MIAIVGGGLAGLEVARRVHGRAILYEASSRMGGRIQTILDPHGTVMYESGPWRVPHDHLRVRALFAEFHKQLIPMSTRALKVPPLDKMVTPGLTTWDVNALETRDALRADALDLDTGYSGQTHSASGSEPYSAADPFYVAPEGFDALVDALVGAIASDDTKALRANHRVLDITRDASENAYTLALSKRIGHNSFATETVTCKHLFVCVPPGVFKHWSIFKEHAKSMSHAVDPGQLHHVYAKDPSMPRGIHVRHPLLGQVISSQYDESSWFQASYSGGRIARLWHHLRMLSPSRFLRELSRELKESVGVHLDEDAEYRSHFWPVAFHVWKPVFKFDLTRAVRMAIRPNPASLPNVFVAGEAFSSYQAWMEGALETAELALTAFDNRLHTQCAMPTFDWVIVEGCVVNVHEWMSRHPGGALPLQNHIGEDVTHLMTHIGHSEQAWAVVHSLKCQ